MTSGPAPRPDRIGRFNIVETLGEGGMGIVYAARDPRLQRDVAVKVLRGGSSDRTATDRMLREARAAAALNHPSFCQIFEIGEEDGRPFLVMELLGGESLACRLQRGALPTREAVQLGLDLLSALEALHREGLVHRDIKPTNIFLTPHGLKVLDFGLARQTSLRDETLSGTTLPGTIVGSPHYMAPEQAKGEPADHRADLFAVGVVLFEMLTGRRPFEGDGVVEVLHSILSDQPPALTGSPAILGVDRVIHRALAKDPGQRHQTATTMAHELRSAGSFLDPAEAIRAQAVKRLAVLPFRQLRPDADIDYLSYGLSDAITSSLLGFESFVVRSSLATARYGNAPELDVRKVASELDVDLLLAGTLLRGGDRLRVGVELIEAATGKAAWSRVEHVALSDVFELQDDLARRIVEGLPLSASDRARRRGRDVPADRRAYFTFLRANRLANEPGSWQLALDLYRQCIDLDPGFAPAWAGLGRMYRVIAKYGPADLTDDNVAAAQDALHRALALNPDLSAAHLYRAQLEADAGHVEQALERLLRRAIRDQAEPEIYAGLVQACRYCGLLSASVAAYELAKRLDPGIQTSAVYTLWIAGDYERALAESQQGGGDLDGLILDSLGRIDEAVAAARLSEQRYSTQRHGGTWHRAMRSCLEGRLDECRAAIAELAVLSQRDGEATYFVARIAARIGETEHAAAVVDRAIERGYYCVPLLKTDPWLASLRKQAPFDQTLARAEDRRAAARAIFERERGPEVLGLRSPD